MGIGKYCPECNAELEYDEDEEQVVCTCCDQFSCDPDKVDYSIRIYKTIQENERFMKEWEREDDEPPEGCLACGGPYPDCISSCTVFDD